MQTKLLITDTTPLNTIIISDNPNYRYTIKCWKYLIIQFQFCLRFYNVVVFVKMIYVCFYDTLSDKNTSLGGRAQVELSTWYIGIDLLYSSVVKKKYFSIV